MQPSNLDAVFEIKTNSMKNLIQIIAICGCLCLIATTGFAQRAGETISKTIDTKGQLFHSIDARNALDVYITQSDEPSIVVKAHPDLMDHVIVEIKNGVLFLKMEKEKKWKQNQVCAVYVNIQELKSLHASGATDIYGESTFKVKHLELHMSGASDLKMAIEASSVECHLSGASDAVLEGVVDRIEVHANGSSDMEAYKLEANVCKIEANGSSDVYLTVKDDVDIEASGSSDVYIKGNPRGRNSKSRGGSDIIFKG